MLKTMTAGIFGILLLEALLLHGEEKEAQVEFNRDIRPIFQDTCFQCHGADAKKAKGDLQLDTLQHATKPNAEGLQAIVPGHPEKSLAWELISSKDAEEVMPPVKSHKTLSAAQKDLIHRWIKQGAVYQPHWAYVPPQTRPLPKVKPVAWGDNAIDAWIATGLKTAGLSPSPEADRPSLIRRASLALTGLAPTPQEVEAFVQDKDPAAYEKLVDRLLASPRYGEERARHWLDLARYGDTHGIHIDNHRAIWPYRDWVIKAFNANQPYDQFSIEQLAGDLLPAPSTDQLVATGYLRCNPTTNEGGAIDEEYQAIYDKDRVTAFSAAWLGVTTACAACHDHKFDPVSQKDFYRLSAYFRNIDTPAMDGNVANTPPVMRLIADPQRLAAMDAEIAKQSEEVDRALNAMTEKSTPAVGNDLVLRLNPDRDGSYTGSLSGKKIHLPRRAAAAGASSLPVLGEVSGDIGPASFRSGDGFSFGGWIKAHRGGAGSVLAQMNIAEAHRGWDLWTENGRIGVHFIESWPNSGLKIAINENFDPELWHHVFVNYDGKAKPAAVTLYLDGVLVTKTELMNNTLKGDFATTAPITLGRRSPSGDGADLSQARDLRIYSRNLAPAEIAAMAQSQEFLSLQGREQALRAEREKLLLQSPETLIARERPQRASAHVLIRGQYDHKGEQVFPGVPAAFGVPLADKAPENRLGLAKWLFEPNHPLTARVAVNRLWQQMFGQGLVATAVDLGTTGEAPSHPELLDALALQFRDSGWDTKALLRSIALSRTYRQSARVSSAAEEEDPRNRLLSHGPRHRLDAEVIRDVALQASGLLVEKLGGPSVKPYQPAGLWEPPSLLVSNTRIYVQDKGESLYRRSLYTYIKRAVPPPGLNTFNATSRESPCATRERTNTPLQALVTLNDPQFVEAARGLAQQCLKRPGSDEERLAFAYQTATSRRADSSRLKIMAAALQRFQAHFAAHQKEAAELIAVGESPRPEGLANDTLAAWIMLTSQLLNLDETLNN